MSVDYIKIFGGLTDSVDKYRRWNEFWDLGEVHESDEEIRTVIEKFGYEHRNSKKFHQLITNITEQVDDIMNVIQPVDSLTEELLNKYIAKIEPEWAIFKLSTTYDENTLFGRVQAILYNMKSNSNEEK